MIIWDKGLFNKLLQQALSESFCGSDKPNGCIKHTPPTDYSKICSLNRFHLHKVSPW